MNNQWKVMEPFPMLNATLLQHDDITPLPHASTMSSLFKSVICFKAGWIATISIFCLLIFFLFSHIVSMMTEN